MPATIGGQAMKTDLSPPPDRLLALTREAFPGRPEAVRLMRAFWRHRRGYDGRFARRLLSTARGHRRDVWEVRLLAALMLQHECLGLSPGDVGEHARLFRDLGLKASAEPDAPLDDRVLEEGYSTTRPGPFLREFRRRLARRESLHRDLREARPALRAWEEFLALGREECALELARYVFTPCEVVERIAGSLRVAEGDVGPHASALVPLEADALLSRWPRFEREIAAELASGGAVYWAGEGTGDRFNALVAQPPGTVVAVIKPPGSPLEIEIKRVGRPDRLPLGAVAERDGKAVPRAHRLDGGSMMPSLRFEAEASALFGTIFRTIWGRPAPIPVTLSNRFVATVPAGDRAVDILDYFGEAEVFGPRFPAMRAALRRAVEAFETEGDYGLPEMEGDRALTVRFVHYTAPGQAILAGTSMYRVDGLARLLGTDGPGSFTGGAREAAPDRGSARRLASASPWTPRSPCPAIASAPTASSGR
jgi:hypothetical protein